MEASENACLKSEIESAKVNEIQFRLATLKEERQQARLHGEETEFGPHGGCPMWASMLLRYCLAWSSMLQVIRMFLHSPSFSVVSPQEISGLEVSACIFFGNQCLCAYMEMEYCESFVAYVFAKNIACCLNYSNRMLSNMKFIVGCLCPVPQP